MLCWWWDIVIQENIPPLPNSVAATPDIEKWSFLTPNCNRLFVTSEIWTSRAKIGTNVSNIERDYKISFFFVKLIFCLTSILKVHVSYFPCKPKLNRIKNIFRKLDCRINWGGMEEGGKSQRGPFNDTYNFYGLCLYGTGHHNAEMYICVSVCHSCHLF